MNEHTNEEFESFLSQLQTTNQTLDFFCDFDKIGENVESIRLSLCMLNSLIGSMDMRRAVEEIWNRDRSAFRVMGILIAVRDGGKKPVIDKHDHSILMGDYFESVDGVMDFLEGSGLKKIFEDRKIKDLVDYVFGIETGLDSNSRKNRSGLVMEKLVANIFERNGIKYRMQVSSQEWESLQFALGNDGKRFDFLVEAGSQKYLIEVNFYSGSGSKLNEVARAYSDISPRINSTFGFKFVWITDGIGWLSARNKLQEAYNIIPYVYNLSNIDQFISILKK